MNDDFEFVIYDLNIVIDDKRWYIIPLYTNELACIPNFNECYLIDEWSPEVNGGDYIISEKIYTWLCLKYGNPGIDNPMHGLYNNELSIKQFHEKIHTLLSNKTTMANFI